MSPYTITACLVGKAFELKYHMKGKLLCIALVEAEDSFKRAPTSMSNTDKVFNNISYAVNVHTDKVLTTLILL